jgi:hypothetical protein
VLLLGFEAVQMPKLFFQKNKTHQDPGKCVTPVVFYVLRTGFTVSQRDDMTKMRDAFKMQL